MKDTLQQALDKAIAGTVLDLAKGAYEQCGPFVVKEKQGSALLPICIEAAQLGSAIITGGSYLNRHILLLNFYNHKQFQKN
ncbi:hypothetical protein P5G65_22505 [Paenibacillus chondroitinus]|uniref:Uncharacterized protein n=1 Tax=Paenibacillus chondroitinus TaxID=59842 RepID=A0ABU6DIK1_9BACL|nr:MULTISPECIES: hypothetical protein [Paenibacillus]MCY9662689.1 hypothetical protein [Paenibacillus anseongense]MEB4796686.1 hypothetical protein [Paenibacillus chondroitinus]